LNHVVEKLLSVQELDVKRLKLKERLRAGPERLLAEEEELDRHRKRYEEAARRAKEAMRVAERKNGEVDAVDKKIQDLYLKLNTARSNKEYEALKTEIAGHRADQEILEEEALQQWSVGEDREGEAAREKEQVEALEVAIATEKEEWEAEARGLEESLGALEEDRSERLKGVPSTWLMVYEKVLDRFGAPALVPIVDQYCQGCQINVSIHDVTRAWKGEEVVLCHSCNRILYAETL
jgi:predicted  nucleic acid-binding Zn-ribbon protein